MKDFSKLLTERTEAIAQQWVETVAQDRQVKSADHLSRPAIENHISHVLTALVSVLAQAQDSDIDTIVAASLSHGALRAEQCFEPPEIAREYHLLRSTILANLRAELLQSTAEEVLRAVSLIDTVVDTAIAQCFKSYVHERLKELEQLQNQLTLTNQELKRLVLANQDNLSQLAHELKTPLTSIIGYADLFLRQQRQSEVRDTVSSLEHIDRVLNSGRHLLHLINDALEISRSEAGKMQLELEVTDVRALLSAVIEIAQPLADARGLKLAVDCSLAPSQVLTDPLRLHQILTNLITNAIRYTKTGSVAVECRTKTDFQWAIAISDTGIGIAPEDQARIFDPYFRVPYLDKSYFPGSTGLGLAIVARLVQLLQGQINVTSEVGVGSTFTLILPREVKI